MNKLLFFILMAIPWSANATLATKDLYTVTDGGGVNQVRIFMEYDDVTLQMSTSPLHCVNSSNFNASFKFNTYGASTNGEVVFPAHTTGTGLFNGSIGLITITNLKKNQFDLLQGYFAWPR